MLDIDKRDPQQIADLICWVQRDEFWMTNVFSMDTLREKFDQLVLKREHPSNGNGRSARKAPANFIKSIQLTQVAQRFLPRAVRGLAQHVPLKNGLAVVGSAGALWNVGQNCTEFREHHRSADVRAAGREFEAECLQSW
jgi:hypothetical protein